MRNGPEQLAARRTFTIVLAAGAFLAGALVVGGIATLAVPHVREAEGQRAAAQAAAEQQRERVQEVLGSVRDAQEVLDEEAAATRGERLQVEGWFSAALQAFALEGLARGWSEVRDDPLPDALATAGLARFREEVEALPARIGRELAEQRDLDDVVEAGIEAVGVFEFLELLHRDTIGPFPDLVADAERFGALFDCAVGGVTVDGKQFAKQDGLSEELTAGATVHFGPGVTTVYNWRLHGPLPHCATIAGEGMDATLLVASAIHDNQRIESLTIRDCTLLASGVDVLDLRGRGSVVRLERVRIIGFDMAAGSSNALRLNHTALFARDCRFEGGYGRSPDNGGTLFDVRTSALLARFERCRFDAMRLGLEDLRDRATVVFADCVMTDLRDRLDPRSFEHPGIRLVNCSVQMAEPDPERKRDWSRDLDELFPGWREAR